MKKIISLQQNWQTEIFSGGAKNFDLPLLLPAENIKSAIIFKNTFTVPDDDDNDVFYLILQYLSGTSTVYLNGHKVTQHAGMFAPFACDISDYLIKGVPQELKIALSPAPTPAGYFTFGGAHVIGVTKSHFDYTSSAVMPLTVRTEIEDRLINVYVDARIVHPNNYDILHYRLFDPTGKQVIAQTTRPTSPQVCFTLSAASLWEGGNDLYRYRLTASLHRDNACIDEIDLSFGIRDINVEGNGFLSLNGIHLPLCGVSLPGARGAYTELDALTALGCNCLMIDAVFPGEDFLFACDRLGLLVLFMLPYSTLPGGKEELIATVRMLSRHPSVCFFGFRAQDVNLAKSFASAVQTARTGVLTVGNTDVLYQESFSDAFSDILLLDADFGADSASQTDFENRFLSACADHPNYRFAVFAAPPEALCAQPGNKTYYEAENTLCDWHEKLWRMFGNKRNVVAYFAGRLYDDTPVGRPGLVCADRTEKRDCFWFYRAQFSADSTLHICNADDIRVFQKKISLKCYANTQRLRLFVRGKERKKIPCDQINDHVFVFRKVKLKRGNNTVAVMSSEETADSTVFRY